jgi:hexosaminidase
MKILKLPAGQIASFFYPIIPILFLFSFHAYGQPTTTLNLMPVPERIEIKEGGFPLTESFTVAVKGADHPRLAKAATRMLRRLASRTGLFFPQDVIRDGEDHDADMRIEVKRIGQVRLFEDESYQLEIKKNGIRLKAETDIGAMRGLETFLQLLDEDDSGYIFPAVVIKDKPRFPWRGLLIDACRHFQPVEVIKRNLDGMAAVKMNVLHWHLTEDQGFRVECKTFPRLHELGSDGDYYTQEQIKEVIQYAGERGIRVMPEFDIPGHSTSWFVGYPQYASQPGPYSIERKFGIMDPTFDPTKEETYTFFDAFFKEMCAIFPDEYLHIGGDENNGNQWNANSSIQQFMQENGIKDTHALQSYFNKRILEILTRYNKKMVGWDEIFQRDMPTNIVIQSWRGKEALIESAKKGYQTILSNGYYIDLIQPTDVHYLNDPLPPDAPLSESQKKYILGGEATMWSEMVTPETIDSRIWPRTAAIAERLWSPASVTDVDDMYRRLNVVSFRLEELSLTHEKNVPMMLRRLTNNQDIEPLKILVDVIEPVKFYERGSQREYTSYSPLTRVVDAARPDASVARNFRKLVDSFLAKTAIGEETSSITCWLELWAANHNKLLPIINQSPVLKEIESLSADLSACADIGLKAMTAINNNAEIRPEDIDAFRERLENAKTPHGETELMIVPAVEKLVKHISEK